MSRLAAQVEVDLSGTHVNFDVAQRQVAEIQLRAPRAAVQDEIRQDLVVELKIPDVMSSAAAESKVLRLADGDGDDLGVRLLSRSGARRAAG